MEEGTHGWGRSCATSSWNKEVGMVFGREIRCQQPHCCEIYRSIAEHVEDEGVFSSGPCGLDTTVGGILGEMEYLHAVGEH